jgi:ubiquinone/menaquinone biosynthesis C-methylase UbiE
MDHQDHVNLLRPAFDSTTRPAQSVWADLGSGGGAFTLALADLLGPTAKIISVDRDSRALREQERQMRDRFPSAAVEYRTADFTQPLDLPPLDGVVMANSLHFLTPRQKEAFLPRLKSYLRPGAALLLVEYNTDQGNQWVPYPFTYKTWEAMAAQVGFENTRLLSTRPSRFLGQIFSAASQR